MSTTINNNSPRKLSDSVILITGALTGIGRATAFAFAKEGSKLIVSGRKEKEGNELAAELKKLGVEAEFIRADVRHEADVKNLVDKTIERFGRIDAAVNNAGTEGELGPIVDQTVENYTATFETNVLGVLLSLKYELRAMTAQGSGSIINVSSLVGKKGFANVSVYSASKHAVEGLTTSAALEVAALGIRVNTVAPGPIETGMLNRFTGTEENKAGFASMVPVKRVGLPEEIAQTIVFLASEKASFITGHTLSVDGGMIAQ